MRKHCYYCFFLILETFSCHLCSPEQERLSRNDTPTAWVETFLSTAGWAATDRSSHELRTLAKYLETAQGSQSSPWPSPPAASQSSSFQ